MTYVSLSTICMIPAMSVIFRRKLKEERPLPRKQQNTRAQSSKLYHFMYMYRTGANEVKVNTFTCINFESFESLKSSSDIKFLVSNIKKNLNFWVSATKTGKALVAPACCMHVKSICYAQQMKRNEKQCTNYQLQLKWHTRLNLQLEIL